MLFFFEYKDLFIYTFILFPLWSLHCHHYLCIKQTFTNLAYTKKKKKKTRKEKVSSSTTIRVRISFPTWFSLPTNHNTTYTLSCFLSSLFFLAFSLTKSKLFFCVHYHLLKFITIHSHNSSLRRRDIAEIKEFLIDPRKREKKHSFFSCFVALLLLFCFSSFVGTTKHQQSNDFVFFLLLLVI